MTRCVWLLVLLAGSLFAPYSLSAATSNSSLRFDGTDDRLQVDVFPAITGPFTVEAWVKPGTQGGGINPRIVELVGSNDTTFRLALGGNQAGLPERPVSLELYFGGRQDVTSGQLLLLPNTWYHVAGVFNGTMQELYVDGVLVGSRSATGTLRSNTVLDIGTGIRLTGDRDTFDGLIDEVRIWDHGRTQEEIVASMSAELTGGEPGLLGYWNLNEGSEQTAADISTNGNDALLGSSVQPDANDPSWNVEGAPIPPVVRFVCHGFDSPLDIGPVMATKDGVLVLEAMLVDESEFIVTNVEISAPPVLQVIFSSGFPTDPATDITKIIPRSRKGLPLSNQFEYIPSIDRWRGALQTDFYEAPGAYSLRMVSGDDSEYIIEPDCEAIYVVQ